MSASGRVAFAIAHAVTAVGAGFFLWAFWNQTLNHDIEWYLITTRRWLEGATLYVDIMEVNPPLNFYLTLPAIWLSDLSGMTEAHAQYVVFACFIAISCSWALNIIAASMHLGPARLVLWQILLVASVIIGGMPSVGQRDHLFVIFVLPWLFGHLPGAQGTPRAQIGRALFAAIGICLKPHFLLMPIAVTLVELVRSRSWRAVVSTSNIVIAVTGLLYVVLVGLLHPEYYAEIVPLGVDTYGAFGFSAEHVLLKRGWLVPLALVISFALLARLTPRPPGWMLLAGAALAGAGTYLIQWTGFHYQVAPVAVLSATGLAWCVLSSQRFSVAGVFAVVTFCLVILQGLGSGTYRNPVVPALAERLGPTTSIVVLSSFVHAGPPLAEATGATWASRYPTMWPLPGALSALAGTDCAIEPGRCAALEEIVSTTRENIVEDLMKFRPDTIVVDFRPGYFSDTGFDWFTFLASDPRFKTLISDYAHEFTIQNLAVHRRATDQ